MIKKLFICPWFGPLPPWIESWKLNMERLKPLGYDYLIDQDLARFKERTQKLLGVEFPGEEGGSKIHDYRATFGVVYADAIVDGGYEFWGHTDFDCLYGRADKWVTDEFLDRLEIHSNHGSYICGPWTLYRDSLKLAWLFEEVDGWKDHLANPRTTGWVEDSFSRVAEREIDRRLSYTYWQTRDLNRFHTLRWGPNGELYEAGEEIMMAHFRRLNPKVYPQQCVLTEPEVSNIDAR